MMSRIQKGMIAGFAATAVVAILEVAKLYLTQSTGALAEVRIFPLILAERLAASSTDPLADEAIAQIGPRLN